MHRISQLPTPNRFGIFLHLVFPYLKSYSPNGVPNHVLDTPLDYWLGHVGIVLVELLHILLETSAVLHEFPSCAARDRSAQSV